MTLDEQIEILQAAKDGKEIECLDSLHTDPKGTWRDHKGIYFNFRFKFRIKPEPEPKVWGYKLSQLRGAWVKDAEKSEHTILSINRKDKTLCINDAQFDCEHAENVFDIIHETVRPESFIIK